MTEKNSSQRIDEILLHQGLVTEDQIKAALEYQREHDGRLGSHLVRLGYVAEAAVLEALANQFECEAVVLSRVNIPSEVVAMIPADVAQARTVMPFAYDESENILKIACENPNDETLRSELEFIVKDKTVVLCIAVEWLLQKAIAAHYGCSLVTGAHSDERRVRITETVPVEFSAENSASPGTVLLVSDFAESDQPFEQALEDDGYEVIWRDSADDALELISEQPLEAVFIRDTAPGNYLELIDRLRKISPRTTVRFYESPARLLLTGETLLASSELAAGNLTLFTTLLATKENLASNHGGTVGHYVDRLCRRLELPEKDRLVIANAAYLHDISRYYYGDSQSAPDCRTRVKLTIKLLDSLNYPPLTIEILRKMYVDLRQRFTKRLPIEALGGNILTMVDIFCENISLSEKVSLDKFELIRNNLIEMSGRLFMPEVITAFLEMIESEILVRPKEARTYNQVLMYCQDVDYLSAIVGRLKDEGFRPVALESVDRFVEMYRRSRPDIIILLQEGNSAVVKKVIDDLVVRGVEIDKVPTFLITSGPAVTQMTSLFEQGLEDVIPIENSLDLLAAKMQKLRAQIEDESQADEDDDGETTVVSEATPEPEHCDRTEI